MRISVLDGDGYCGWARELYLSKKGHEVSIVHSFARPQSEYELGVQTLIPIRSLPERLRTWQELTRLEIESVPGDIPDYDFLPSVIRDWRPMRWCTSPSSRARVSIPAPEALQPKIRRIRWKQGAIS